MNLKLKKIHWALIALALFLLVTNPSLKEFKEHLAYPGVFQSRIPMSRQRNYFICSTFRADSDTYFAIAGNFFRIPPKQ